jgi:hypothetical protein
VDAQFRIALRLFDRAMSLPGSAPDLAAASAFVLHAPTMRGAFPAATTKDPSPAAARAELQLGSLSLRDLLQRLAAERGLAFLPKANRTTADGKTLYSLGSQTLYVEQDVAFVLTSGKYLPTAIDELLQRASV